MISNLMFFKYMIYLKNKNKGNLTEKNDYHLHIISINNMDYPNIKNNKHNNNLNSLIKSDLNKIIKNSKNLSYVMKIKKEYRATPDNNFKIYNDILNELFMIYNDNNIKDFFNDGQVWTKKFFNYLDNEEKKRKKKEIDKSRVKNKKFRVKVYDKITKELFIHNKNINNVMSFCKKGYFKTILDIYSVNKNKKDMLKIIHEKYHSNEFESLLMSSTYNIEKQNRCLTFLSQIDKSLLNYHSFYSKNEFLFLEQAPYYFKYLYEMDDKKNNIPFIKSSQINKKNKTNKISTNRTAQSIALYYYFLLFKKHSLIHRYYFLKKIYKLRKYLRHFKNQEEFYLLGEFNKLNIKDDLKKYVSNRKKIIFRSSIEYRSDIYDYKLWEELIAYKINWFGNFHTIFMQYWLNHLARKKNKYWLLVLYYKLESLQWSLHQFDNYCWNKFKGKDFFYINFHMNIETEIDDIYYKFSSDPTDRKLIVKSIQEWVYGNPFEHDFLCGKTSFVNYFT